MTFGEKLQQLRRQQGLSQEKLAEKLGVSRQAVSKWELGDTLPETEKIKQLKRLFGVSADYLLFDEIEEDNAPSAASIPAEQKHKDKRGMFAVGAVCAGLGGAGGMVLLLLSTIIQVPVMKKRLLPDGTTEYYGGGNVLGCSFPDFIQHYRLQAVLMTLVVLLIVGIGIITFYLSEKYREKQK